MASDTVTATDNTAEQRFAETAEEASEHRDTARRPAGVSPLTRRILGVNVIALVVLGVALFQLGGYQQSLVETEIAALKTRAQVFAAALGEGAVTEAPGGNEELSPEMAS